MKDPAVSGGLLIRAAMSSFSLASRRRRDPAKEKVIVLRVLRASAVIFLYQLFLASATSCSTLPKIASSILMLMGSTRVRAIRASDLGRAS